MTAVWQDRFTATGRPMPAYKEPSTWERCSPWGPQAPIHPPFRFTDETIIPVMVRVEEPDVDEKLQTLVPQMNIFEQLKCWLNGANSSHPHTICVFMPRGEYLKHFAHDHHGNYIGSEVQRSWSEEDLYDKFGAYQHSRSPRWVLCSEEGRVFMAEERKMGAA